MALAAKSFLKSVFEVMSEAGVTEDKIERMTPKLTELVEDYTTRMSRMETEVDLQKETINRLIQRIGSLERKVKQNIEGNRRRDYNLVRNNVIVRSSGSVGDVQKYLSEAIQLGGGGKITQKSLAVAEISAPPGTTRDHKIFRVVLAHNQKSFLFKGLAKANLGPEGPRVDNETPAYLIDTKKKLERVAYSLRFHFKASHQVKTKLVLSSGKLRIKVKDKDNATWINLDDARASSYLGSEVKFKPEEVPKGGVPSVGDFYKRVLEALD